VTEFSTSECILNAESETILSALGGKRRSPTGAEAEASNRRYWGAAATHIQVNFFLNTDNLCSLSGKCLLFFMHLSLMRMAKSSIWGLTKQGKTCKACGISVHGKCEMKVSLWPYRNCCFPDGIRDRSRPTARARFDLRH
jgi:hypothetical protein